jgi:hypothetical protein
MPEIANMPLERAPRKDIYKVPWFISDDIITSTAAPPNTVVVHLTPKTATLGAGTEEDFTAVVTGSFNQACKWSVNGTDGGGGLLGTVSGTGQYVASSDATRPASVTLKARAVAKETAFDTAVITLTELTISVTVTSTIDNTVDGTVPVQLTATVGGTADQGVTWYVNDVAGGNPTIGTITPEGLYIPPGTVGQPPTVTIKAKSTARPAVGGTKIITNPPVVSPAPPSSGPVYDPNNILPTGSCSGTIEVIQSAYVWGSEALPNPNAALTDTQIACHMALFAIEVADAKKAQEDAGKIVTVLAGVKWHTYSDSGTYLGMGAKMTCDPHVHEDDHTFALSGYITLTQAICITNP